MGDDGSYYPSIWRNIEQHPVVISTPGYIDVECKVKLVLDHINGDISDERLSNLRFICYNCDPFTPHFNRKKHELRRDIQIILKEQELWGYRREKEGDDKCVSCRRTHWTTIINGEEMTLLIPLEVDHIDGNHKNDDPNNLRALCRQCHANTQTYGGYSSQSKKIKL